MAGATLFAILYLPSSILCSHAQMPPTNPPALVGHDVRSASLASASLDPRLVTSSPTSKMRFADHGSPLIDENELIRVHEHVTEIDKARGLLPIERVGEWLNARGANRFQLLAPRTQNEVDVVSHFAPLPE